MSILLLGCFLAFAGSLYYYTKINAKLFNYYEMKSVNTRQKQQLDKFNEETRKLSVSLEYLKERDQEVRGMLGIKDYGFSGSTQEALKKKHLNKLYRDSIVQLSADKLERQLFVLNKDFVQSNLSYHTLLTNVQEMKRKYDYTPTIWPITGQIFSPFGWRRHPVFGRMEFHRGVDIAAFVGANVRSSGKGRVVYSGWYSGYGNMVIVYHRDGISSVYGHNSKLLVKPGDMVEKGQLIAKAGSTGLSTGPHVHFEVRKWNQSINPNKFLNMDIFTASKDL